MLLEQGTALTLRHATPDAELNPVVQGVSATFGDHRTMPTDHGRLALGGAAHEQLVWIC